MDAGLRDAAAIAEDFRKIVVGDDIARIERQRREVTGLRSLPITEPVADGGEAELRPGRLGPLLARPGISLAGGLQSPDRFETRGGGNVAFELWPRRQLPRLQHDHAPALRAIP